MKRLDIDVEPSLETGDWEQRLTDGSPLLRYACALLLAAVAIGGTLAVPVLRTGSPFVLAFGAIAISAWYSGFGPALVVIVVTTITLSLAAEPIDVWRLVVADAVRLGVFTLVAAGIATLAATRRRVTMVLRRQNERLEAVHRLSVAARGLDPIDTLYAKGVEAVETALGASGTAILVVDEDGSLRLVAVHGLPTMRQRSETSTSRACSQTTSGSALIVSDLVADAAPVPPAIAEALRTDKVRTAAWFPFLSHEQVIGELIVCYDVVTEFDERLIQLGETIAAHLALVVERHRAEEILGKGEAQLRLALRAAGMGSWEYRPQRDHFFWSPELETMHGRPAGSVSGTLTDFLDCIHPDDRDTVREAIERCASGARSEFDVEYRIECSPGEQRWLAALGRVLPRSGRTRRLSGVCMDVTDRKEAEAARARLLAAEQEARLEVEREHGRASFLAEASAMLGTTLDRETMLREVAQVVVPRIADWCAVDLLDDGGTLRRVTVAHVDPDKVRWANQLHEHYPPKMDGSSGVARVLRTGQSDFLPEITDAQLERSAQSSAHLEQLRSVGFRSAMVIPLVARQRTLGALTLVTAESGRRYTEADLTLAEELARRVALAVDNAQLFRKLEEASQAKDEFLATVSHELRTPLNAILGWANMLKSGAVSGDQEDQALGAVERNATVLTQLVSDVLDISRIVNGQLSLDLEPLRLEAVVDAALDAVRPSAVAKEVAIERRTDGQAAESTVVGDPARLQQIIWNLVSNAVKFTPPGGRVTVSLEAVGSWLEVRVADTGEGIEPRFLPVIFDRFRQADGSTTRRHGGLGLGLAIVRHLVELHGGNVEVSSDGKDQGAMFTVRLPVGPAASQGAALGAARPPASAIEETALQGCRVLAVDDNDDARALLDYVLGTSGADARIAGSGDSAMAMLVDDWWPDIVVLDIGMPDEDGYSFLARLLERFAQEDRPAPLAVALTAHAGVENRARALSAGFQLYLPKPLEPPTLVEELTRLWQSRAPLAG